MYTIIIAAFVVIIAGFILDLKFNKETLAYLTRVAALGLVFLGFINNNMSEIEDQASKGVEVARPEKHINQTYYIDNSNRLYIQQNDTTKQFGGDISSKIEYKDSAKEPSIKFKTIKIKGDPDNWIPFKYKEVSKTYISKVILPKSDLTEKLTEMTVLK